MGDIAPYRTRSTLDGTQHRKVMFLYILSRDGFLDRQFLAPDKNIYFLMEHHEEGH